MKKSHKPSQPTHPIAQYSVRKGQSILPRVLYQNILADYLSANDLIRLAAVFDEMGYTNIFSALFWKKRLSGQYGRLLETLPERKDEESQKISSLLQAEKYQKIYEILQIVKIAPTDSRKENIFGLLKNDQESEQKTNREDLKRFLSELTWLSLRYGRIDVQGASRLSKGLQVNTTLTYLNLRGNRIGDLGVEQIADCLKVNTTLTSLDLFDNQISDLGGSSLAAALKVNTTLTILDLSCNRIDNAGVESIASALENNDALTSLNFHDNHINSQGAAQIAAALEKNSMLTILNLSWNRIGAEGAAAIAFSLEKNVTLTNLDFQDNQIGVAGAVSIAVALEKNATLTNLNLARGSSRGKISHIKSRVAEGNKIDIHDNQIGEEGAISIGLALEKNKLTHLNLRGAQIGNLGAARIGAALEKNTTLLYLILANTQIGDVGFENIVAALEKNTTLIRLEFCDNPINERLKQKIYDLMNRNYQLRESCITALKQDSIQFAQELLQGQVSYNGVLLKLTDTDETVPLEVIQNLFQLAQSHADLSYPFPFSRGVILEAISNAKNKNHTAVVFFLRRILSCFPDYPTEQEEKKDIKISPFKNQQLDEELQHGRNQKHKINLMPG